jgi:hypothetical protein
MLARLFGLPLLLGALLAAPALAQSGLAPQAAPALGQPGLDS